MREIRTLASLRIPYALQLALCYEKGDFHCDSLSAVIEVFYDLNDLLSISRPATELLLSFKSRLAAQVDNFNSNGSRSHLPESLTAPMLLSKYAIENSQRIAVLAAAAPFGANLNSQSLNDEIMKAVLYQSLSFVLRQSDKPSTSSPA